jgi:ankyrin repeat protein
VVQRLVRAGAAVTRKGWSPIGYAAFQGHLEVVRFLLDSGADVDARAPNQATPLMFAARNGHIEVARLLIERGADVDLKSDTGASAMVWAAERGNTDIMELIQAAPIR